MNFVMRLKMPMFARLVFTTQHFERRSNYVGKKSEKPGIEPTCWCFNGGHVQGVNAARHRGGCLVIKSLVWSCKHQILWKKTCPARFISFPPASVSSCPPFNPFRSVGIALAPRRWRKKVQRKNTRRTDGGKCQTHGATTHNLETILPRTMIIITRSAPWC